MTEMINMVTEQKRHFIKPASSGPQKADRFYEPIVETKLRAAIGCSSSRGDEHLRPVTENSCQGELQRYRKKMLELLSSPRISLWTVGAGAANHKIRPNNRLWYHYHIESTQ